MIIAIDGPAASGKGTISKGLAAHYNLPHLDSGLLYRAVGFQILNRLDGPGMSEDLIALAESIAQNIDPSSFDPVVLGAPDVALAAAKVARLARVRAALFNVQRVFATQEGGAVLDGRDMGSRICPEADVKLFITASPEIRAKRRTAQLQGQGMQVNGKKVQGEKAHGEKVLESDILAQIIERDESDRSNPAGAFYPASDAHLLDTSKLDIEATLEKAIALVEKAMSAKMN